MYCVNLAETAHTHRSTIIGYESARLTVHLPPKKKRSWVSLLFLHRCLVPQKKIPKENVDFIGDIKVLEKCTKNLIGHSRLAFNNHESNIDC